MLKTHKINNSVTIFKALDPELRTFDIVMETQYGTSYNSYIIDGGDELALVDTAKEKYFDEYIKELEKEFDLKKIKYLIVNHTEPDHSGEVHKLLEKMPWLEIVGSQTALGFLKDISNKEFKSINVKEDFKLKVGNKTLSFIIAPNLHWPDSMFTLLEEENFLFTCDVFGTHYCTKKIFDDEVESKSDYKKSFKYYYDVIFAPFKQYVNSGIKKIEDLNKKITYICPSHGPVIKGENFKEYKNLYLAWSKETNINPNKITIAYVSAYGYTKHMAEEIKKTIELEGFETSLIDIEKTKSEIVQHEIDTSFAFLIGSPTLNGDTLPNIWEIILGIDKYKNNGKLAGAFGAVGWSGEAVKNIESRLSQINCEVFRPGLKIKFNPDEEEKLEKVREFAKNFSKKAKKMQNCSPDGEWCQIKTGLWKCLICGEIYEGEFPPDPCPACGAPADQFVAVESENISFKSQTDEKIIIIGSGIAAVSAADSIRKRNNVCQIEIISEENSLPYFRILLSKKLFIEKNIDLIKEESWFEENNIKLTLNTKISKIVPEENKIILENNDYKNYNKLIIATGTRANKIPTKGDDKNGIFYLKNKADFDKINNYASKDNVNKIIIVGGGILGIEMASSLKKCNKDIEVIEYAPRLMFRQLDEGASKIFHNILEKNNLKFRCSESIEEIYGTGQDFKEVCGVKLKHSQDTINCQMIIFATGNTPNIELTQFSGINTNKGIIVNEYMRTNIENIYAAGDVAEFENSPGFLWATAIDQGKIAGANAIGDNSKTYIKKEYPVSFNEFDCKIFSIGDLGVQKKIEEYQILELSDLKNRIYRKFYFTDNMFVGGILIGDTSKAIQVQRSLSKSSTLQTVLDVHFLDE